MRISLSIPCRMDMCNLATELSFEGYIDHTRGHAHMEEERGLWKAHNTAHTPNQALLLFAVLLLLQLLL